MRPSPLRHLAGLRWMRLVQVAAVAAVALLILGSWRPAVWPFKTYGAIYVDSPEVYTRERLVNDRYDQDHWLRNQLEALDVDPNLVSRILRETLTADARAPAAGGGDAAEAPAPPAAATDAPPTELDFSDQFTITAGLRDRIRQMMLENMLDDRHDLLGNSMYGFKFDTTVLPGDNTRTRAFVRVRASIERFFSPAEDGAADPSMLPPHLLAALQRGGPERERLDRYNTHYTNWLANIESRLNNFVANYYGYNGPTCPTDEGWEPGTEIESEIADLRARMIRLRNSIRARRDEAEQARADAAALRETAETLEAADAAQARRSEATESERTAQTAEMRATRQSARLQRAEAAFTTLLLARGRDLVNEVTVRALQTVLSIPPESILASIEEAEEPEDPRSLSWVELDLREPDPWRLFFDVFRKEVMTDCGPRPQFVVREALDTLYIIDADEDGAFPEWASPYYYRMRTPEAMKRDAPEGQVWDDEFVAVSFDGVINSLDEYAALVPRFDFPAAFVAEARARGLATRFCHTPGATLDTCPEGQVVEAFTVNAGLFNLIEQLDKQDAYSYAVFPKSDAEGVLLRRRLDARASAGGWLGLGRGSSEESADAASVLVGFGDSRVVAVGQDGGADDASGKAIEFGWVVTPPSRGDAVQRTQMALISVPAWADEVSFDVTTGWLDDDARERIDVRTHRVSVPLPPDFEALDIVMWGGALHVRRRPIILDDFMDPPHGPMVLAACRAAEILIPGTRLWRSTAVTLGGQTASRIRVLPNMDGILAEFNSIAPPARTLAEGQSDQRILRVWTSEGSATSSKDIQVIVPDDVDGDCEPRSDAAAR